jgi:GT2 family glycosyltransferase
MLSFSAVQEPPAPLVDLVIVNYRSYDELHRCLTSLEPHREGLGRVVVIDHESDLTAASQISGRFRWATIVERSTNEGFATGVNLGARLTNAPFLVLLNPDCVADGHAIMQMLAFAQAHADAAIVGPCILNSDGSVQGSARRFPGITTAIAGRSSWLTRHFPGNPLSRHNLPALDRRGGEPIDVDWVSGACMLVRRAAFDQVGGMDERFFLYWEDADLCKRLSERNWRTVYVPGAVIVHAGGRSSIHAYRESLSAFHDSAFMLFRKHAGWPARLLEPLVYAGLQLRLRAVLLLRKNRLRSAGAKASREHPVEGAPVSKSV